MINKKMLCIASFVAVASIMTVGCGDSNETTDNGNDTDTIVTADVVDDVVASDTATPEDTVEEVAAPCPPYRCVDDGNGNLVETPTPGCVGDFCAAGPDADPEPTEMGPYPVGIRQLVLVDNDPENANDMGDGTTTPRTLKVDIWFPTTEEYRDAEHFIYDVKEDCNDAVKEKFGEIEIGQFEIPAVMDAPVRHGEGRYPVVVFSHGAYGIRFQSVFFTIALASHGYVVVAPDHEYNTLNEILVDGWNGADLVPAALHRPRDVIALLNWVQAKGEDPEDEFYDLLDMENCACTGHSFGGLTSYIATMDDRIDCIVPMAPEASMASAFINIFGNTPIEELSIPTLVMGGEMDNTLDYQSSQRDWFDLQPAPKWMLSMPRAGHYTFTDVCDMNLEELIPYWGDADDAMEDGCADFNFDYKEAHEAINLYAISFLNHFLRKSPDALNRLSQAAGAEWGEDVEFIAVPE